MCVCVCLCESVCVDLFACVCVCESVLTCVCVWRPRRDPIMQLFDAIMTAGKEDKVTRMLKTIGVALKADERELRGKALLKRVMHKWLPAGDAILEMVVMHLPSPREAQKYRYCVCI